MLSIHLFAVEELKKLEKRPVEIEFSRPQESGPVGLQTRISDGEKLGIGLMMPGDVLAIR